MEEDGGCSLGGQVWKQRILYPIHGALLSVLGFPVTTTLSSRLISSQIIFVIRPDRRDSIVWAENETCVTVYVRNPIRADCAQVSTPAGSLYTSFCVTQGGYDLI